MVFEKFKTKNKVNSHAWYWHQLLASDTKSGQCQMQKQKNTNVIFLDQYNPMKILPFTNFQHIALAAVICWPHSSAKLGKHGIHGMQGEFRQIYTKKA